MWDNFGGWKPENVIALADEALGLVEQVVQPEETREPIIMILRTLRDTCTPHLGRQAGALLGLPINHACSLAMSIIVAHSRDGG